MLSDGLKNAVHESLNLRTVRAILFPFFRYFEARGFPSSLPGFLQTLNSEAMNRKGPFTPSYGA